MTQKILYLILTTAMVFPYSDSAQDSFQLKHVECIADYYNIHLMTISCYVTFAAEA